MIPEFPKSKKLEFADRIEIKSLTDKYPPYSDFDFMSMWCWNTKEEMQISKLDSNLVVRFTDYLSGEPFLSFIGEQNVSETAEILLQYSLKNSIEPKLELIPEITASGLKPNIFSINENQNHFDYIYLIENLISYEGKNLKVHRNSLASFQRKYVAKADFIDLANESTVDAVCDLYRKWGINRGFIIPNEAVALQRFLKKVKEFEFLAVGVEVDNKLVAFSLFEKTTHHYINCLFAKGDVQYSGIYSYLMSTSASLLSKNGYKYINFEQDLGLYNLRKSKQSFNPDHFLKKYTVTLKNEDYNK